MAEIRCGRVYKDGVYIGETDCVEVSDEELAEEKEQEAMRKAEDLIDAITSLANAKVFLKRLVRRLIKNGALP